MNIKGFRESGTPFLILFLVVSVVEILLISGITYGWANFVGVLKQENFFDLCKTSGPNRTLSGNFSFSSATSPPDSNSDCSSQNKRLNLVMTVSVFTLCGTTFLIGSFVDKFGPRVSRLVGCIIYIGSGIALAFASKDASNILFLVFNGFCIGGTFIAIAIYQVTSLVFERVKSLVLCILHGTFDSSAVILLLFKIAYENGFNLMEISVTYIILCAVIVLPTTFFLTPKNDEVLSLGENKQPDIGQSMLGINYVGIKLANYSLQVHDENVLRGRESPLIRERMSLAIDLDDKDGTRLMLDKTRIANGMSESEKPKLDYNSTPVNSIPRDSLWNCFKSPLYLTDLLFLSVIQLRLWFFISEIEPLISLLTDNDEDQKTYYLNIFGYTQLCGIIVAPFIGLAFDKSMIKDTLNQGKRPLNIVSKLREAVFPLVATITLALLLSALILVNRKEIIIPCCILHVVVRGFVYSDHASFIGITFPVRFFGRLYGLGMLLSGIFGALQFALFVVMEDHLNGKPFWMDVALLVVTSFGIIQPVYVWFFCRREARRAKNSDEVPLG